MRTAFFWKLAMALMLLMTVNVCAKADTLRKGGSIVGKIEANGDIRVNGSICGRIENNGDIRKNGSIIGRVESNGDVRLNGSIIGRVENNGDIRYNGSIIGRAEQMTNKRRIAVMYFFGFFKL